MRPKYEWLRRVAITVNLVLILLLAIGHSFASKASENLKPIGGQWYVTGGENPVYLYKEGERFVDPFSHHSNGSIVKSQSYPNHPGKND